MVRVFPFLDLCFQRNPTYRIIDDLHGEQGSQEPEDIQSAGKAHGGENDEEDQGVACIRADDDIDAEEQGEVKGQGYGGEKAAEALFALLQVGDLPRQQEDEGDLQHLRGLDADAAEADPAAVSRIACLAEKAQGCQQQKVEAQQQIPAVCDHVRVDQGKDHEEHEAQDQREDLHRHVAPVFIGAGGAVNEDQAEDRGGDAEQQQGRIRHAQIIDRHFSQPLHASASFRLSL